MQENPLNFFSQGILMIISFPSLVFTRRIRKTTKHSFSNWTISYFSTFQVSILVQNVSHVLIRHNSSITPSHDNARRLIQTAYVCFQQLNHCNELNDEQKQYIQTWMEAVTNVRYR